MQLVSGTDAFDEGTVTFAELRVFAPVQANLGVALLGHDQVDVDLSLWLLCATTSNSPFKLVLWGNQTCSHDKVGVDRNGIRDSWSGILLLLGGCINTGLQWAEDLDKALALVLVGKVACVIAWCQSSLPRNRPNLQKMNSVSLVLIEFAVSDASASGGELDVSAVHAVEGVGLSTLFALGEHGIAMCQFTTQDVAENFKIAMRVGRESVVCLDTVLVEDSQRAKVVVLAHEVGKAKGVVGVEPAMVAVAALCGQMRGNLSLSKN